MMAAATSKQIGRSSYFVSQLNSLTSRLALKNFVKRLLCMQMLFCWLIRRRGYDLAAHPRWQRKRLVGFHLLLRRHVREQ
jgi:hypothetical protein